MNSRKSGCGCLPIVGLITALAVGVGYIYQKGWHQLLISRSLTPLTGAKVIPDEAMMTSFIATDSKNWQQLDKLGIEKTPKIVEQVTTEIDKELSASDLDYQEDIEPWLGNAMLAVIPETSSLQESSFLIVLGIKNPLEAYQFIKKIQTNEQDSITSITHKGIKINTTTNDLGNESNLALLGNKIVISDKITTIKQAIDTFKGEPSLASDPETQVALKQPLKLNNDLVKVYIPNYDRLLGGIFKNAIAEAKINNLQPVKSLVFGIGTAEKQIKIQSFTQLKSNIELPQYQPIKHQIADRFPEQTIAFINGQGLNTFWTTLLTLSEQDREFRRTIDGMRVSTRWLTGLDLDEDVFSWMDGEFAIGIVPTTDIIPDLNVKSGLALILESSDRDTTQNTLNVIGNQLQRQLGIVSQSTEINQQAITKWSVPYSNLDLSYGWLDEKNLLLTFGNNVFDSMNNSANNSLPTSSNFRQLAKQLPNKNLSYFYLNMEQARAEIAQIPDLPLDFNSESMLILNSIKGIGAASTMTDSQTTKTDLFVMFK